jgi:hypothetical protein
MMKPKMKNPFQNALIPIGLLTVFSSFITFLFWGLSAAARIEAYFAWIALTFFVFFFLVWIIIWLLGIRKVQRIREFLNSSRPIIRWTYSATEWRQIREQNWQEVSQDWKIQWGCLSFLLGLVGLMTGAMLGLGDGLGKLSLWALIGLVIGFGTGLLIGGIVAGGNHLSSWLAYRQEEPVEVALGVGEIFNGYDYFCADGSLRLVRNIELDRGSPDTLTFTLEFPPRPRMPYEESWVIPVPTQFVDRVEELIPVLKG